MDVFVLIFFLYLGRFTSLLLPLVLPLVFGCLGVWCFVLKQKSIPSVGKI